MCVGGNGGVCGWRRECSNENLLRPPLNSSHPHTQPVTALITLVTYIDRANLALAAPVLLPDLAISKRQYGVAASIFFVTYGSLQIPLSAVFTTKVGFGRWFAFLVGVWGLTTMATAAVKGAASLYTARLVLGAAEAATLPGCFALLSRFNTPGAMRVAYPLMLTLTLVSSVVGGPLGAAILGPMQGVAGLASWRWLFIIEGGVTVIIAACLPLWVPETVGDARWLSGEEREAAAADLVSAALAAGVPVPATGGGRRSGQADTATLPPHLAAAAADADAHDDSVSAMLRDALRILTVPEIWVLGAAAILSQFAFWILLYFVPLEIASAFGNPAAAASVDGDARAAAHRAATAALKSAIVFLPGAAGLVFCGYIVQLTSHRGGRKWVAAASLTLSAVGFAALPPASAAPPPRGPAAGLALLTLAAVGGSGSMGVLSTWPHPYLRAAGRHTAAGFAAFNACSSVAGLVGPAMAGAMPRETAMFVVAGLQIASAIILFVFGWWEDARSVRRAKAAV